MDDRAGPQIGEGADLGVRAHLRLENEGMDHGGAVTDRGAARGGVRADLAALADHGAALQDRARSDGGVMADRHSCLHPGGARVQEGDTPPGVALDDPALGGVLGQHQARAIVHAEPGVGVVGLVRGDRAALSRRIGNTPVR